MRTPRRYRLALMAYPDAYREARGPELLATLAEGDEERGGPSMRESVALVGRGIAMRTRLLSLPDWLLVAAAALPLIAQLGGLTWVQRIFDDSTILMTGPGWWPFATGVAGFVALAVLLFEAHENARRRRVTALMVIPLAFVLFAAPGNLLNVGLPSPGLVFEYMRLSVEGSVVNWTHTLPAIAAAVVATWLVLTALATLAPEARRRVLSLALAGLAAVAVASSLSRPELPADYAQSAFADLGGAALLVALSVPLAIAALWPARPKPQL